MSVVPVHNKNNLKVTLLEICKTQKKINHIYLAIVYFFVCFFNKPWTNEYNCKKKTLGIAEYFFFLRCLRNIYFKTPDLFLFA